MPESSVFLIRGDDATLLGRAVHDLVDRLVGGEDRTLVLDELDEDRSTADSGEPRLAPLVDAAQTPPFLTGHRVVVGRALGRFSKAGDVAPLVAYLGDPLASTRLVLVWERGRDQSRLSPIPKPLLTAIETAGGEIIDVKVPRGRQVQGWLQETAAAAGVDLGRDALVAIAAHIGDDHGRVPALLDTLHSAFGSDVRLDAISVAPYLGEAGDVAPWELTDAIADGDVPTALARLHRMQSGGQRHPLALMATLQSHYGRILRLDGSGIGDEKAAAAALGMKGSTFPAKKAMQQARAMGSDRIKRAIDLLARADLALRGATAVDETTTMEVLVARLTALHR